MIFTLLFESILPLYMPLIIIELKMNSKRSFGFGFNFCLQLSCQPMQRDTATVLQILQRAADPALQQEAEKQLHALTHSPGFHATLAVLLN